MSTVNVRTAPSHQLANVIDSLSFSMPHLGNKYSIQYRLCHQCQEATHFMTHMRQLFIKICDVFSRHSTIFNLNLRCSFRVAPKDLISITFIVLPFLGVPRSIFYACVGSKITSYKRKDDDKRFWKIWIHSSYRPFGWPMGKGWTRKGKASSQFFFGTFQMSNAPCVEYLPIHKPQIQAKL